MTNPSKELYWDDYVVGRSWEFGTYEMRQDEIVAFARQFDPHPFHLDPEQGKASPIGIFCASGAHTICASHRLLCDGLLLRSRVYAGGGLDDVVLCSPVVPGDVLSIAVKVLSATAHPHRPHLGWVRLAVTTYRQDRSAVLRQKADILMLRAPDPAAT